MAKYFYGHQISEYGEKHGKVDYRCLASCFDAVLNNDIIQNTCRIGYWEIENGQDYDEEMDTFTEIYQTYIISSRGAQILCDETDEIVYYNEDLDMYVWAVGHWGTSWDYVLTDIDIPV